MALARVFYQQPRLIVADDPLAAVDAHVGRHVGVEARRGGDAAEAIMGGGRRARGTAKV